MGHTDIITSFKNLCIINLVSKTLNISCINASSSPTFYQVGNLVFNLISNFVIEGFAALKNLFKYINQLINQ